MQDTTPSSTGPHPRAERSRSIPSRLLEQRRKLLPELSRAVEGSEHVIGLKVAVSGNAEVRKGSESHRPHLEEKAGIVEVLEQRLRIRVLGHSNESARLSGERGRCVAGASLLEEGAGCEALDQGVEACRRGAEVLRRAENDSVGLGHPVER